MQLTATVSRIACTTTETYVLIIGFNSARVFPVACMSGFRSVIHGRFAVGCGLDAARAHCERTLPLTLCTAAHKTEPLPICPSHRGTAPAVFVCVKRCPILNICALTLACTHVSVVCTPPGLALCSVVGVWGNNNRNRTRTSIPRLRGVVSRDLKRRNTPPEVGGLSCSFSPKTPRGLWGRRAATYGTVRVPAWASPRSARARSPARPPAAPLALHCWHAPNATLGHGTARPTAQRLHSRSARAVFRRAVEPLSCTRVAATRACLPGATIRTGVTRTSDGRLWRRQRKVGRQ